MDHGDLCRSRDVARPAVGHHPERGPGRRGRGDGEPGHHPDLSLLCGSVLGGDLRATLRTIASLPDASGVHACECGHLEMRLLPDGVYRCPACGSGVTPVSVAPTGWKPAEHSGACWCDWLDGRYGAPARFTENGRPAKWEDPSDRLDYYRGHRSGREARLLHKGSLLKAS